MNEDLLIQTLKNILKLTNNGGIYKMQTAIIILVIILFLFVLAGFISTIKNNIYQTIAEEKENQIKDQQEQLERAYKLVNKLDYKNEQLQKEIERLKKDKKNKRIKIT